MVSYEEVYEAYWDCMEHKGNTIDAIRFEIDAEAQCMRLCQQLNDRTYRPSRSIAFINEWPVKREIFGAAFRDRVADTVFARRVAPLLEKQYIDDNYSTRPGKGTLYGIHRVEDMIREMSDGYTQDCWVMKLDMQSYFMSLPKERAYQKFAALLKKLYHEDDLEWLCWLLHTVITDRPELHCVRNSPKEAWEGLPPSKSLFCSDGKHGMPIGKVISQMTALVFMDDLDHEITEGEWKEELRYGHYMDDSVYVSRNLALLMWLRDNVVDEWAQKNGVRRHPKKMYLQHYSKGVLFTGGMILPGRTYLSKRTVGRCMDKIERYNRLASDNPGYAVRHRKEFVSVMNSYFGIMRHFAARHIVHRLCSMISTEWYEVMYIDTTRRQYKAVMCHQYNDTTLALQSLETDMYLLCA